MEMAAPRSYGGLSTLGEVLFPGIRCRVRWTATLRGTRKTWQEQVPPRFSGSLLRCIRKASPAVALGRPRVFMAPDGQPQQDRDVFHYVDFHPIRVLEKTLVIRIPRLLLTAHRLKTIPAIHGFVGSGQEGHLGGAAAVGAHGRVELARAGGAPSVRIAAIAGRIVPSAVGVAVGLAFGPARLTSHGRREPAFRIERLLSRGENELLTAIAAGECSITHTA